MHSQNKNGVQGRIFKSSLMMLKTLLICQVVLKFTSIFFSFLPTHLPAIELIPGDLKKGSETNIKIHKSHEISFQEPFPFPSLAEGEHSGRSKDPRSVFTCTKQFGEKTKAKQ